MGTAIAGAIDYLVAGLPAVLTVVDSTAVVVDGIEVEGQSSQSMVFIAKRDPNQTSAGDGGQQLLVLGAGRAQEEFEIPCVVWAYRPGPTVKPARDAAVAMFDVVANFVATDRTFGGLLQQGRVADITHVQIDQDVAGDAGAARVVWLSFSIRIKNHYIP